MFGWLYRILLWLALPALLLRLEWRAWREPEYGRRIGERFGRVPPEAPSGGIWFHAVSAGEAIAAAPLIAALDALPVAGRPFLVTSTTPAGSAEIRRRLPGCGHCYAPYDFPFAVRAFFSRVRPRLLVLVETELWPNLIGEAHRRGVPVLLINARLSKRSARRYALAPGLTRKMLGRVRFIACQHEEDAARFRALGAAAEKVAAFGSIKFDAALPKGHADQVAALREQLGLVAKQPDWETAGRSAEASAAAPARQRSHAVPRDAGPRDAVPQDAVPQDAVPQGAVPQDAGSQDAGSQDAEPQNENCAASVGAVPVSARHRLWLAGSTHAGEEEIALQAHREVRQHFPFACLLLTPRHPVRAAAVCALARRMGFAASLLSDMKRGAERSGMRGRTAPPEVLVCDSMGQLQQLYGLSDIAFLGGSLVPAGGHNPIEAALCSQPLIAGPHTFNFSQVMEAFAEAGCLTRVRTAGQLAAAVLAGLQNEGPRRAAGRRALQAVAERRGAKARLLDLLRREIRAAAGDGEAPPTVGRGSRCGGAATPAA